MEDFVLSRSSNQRHWEANHLEISCRIYETIQQDPPDMLPFTGIGNWQKTLGNNMKALAVILSSHPQQTNGKLLGIKKIDDILTV